MTPRTEPMPHPVPEWLKRATVRQISDVCPRKAGHVWYATDEQLTIARLLWKMGEPDPASPDAEAVKRIIAAWYKGCSLQRIDWSARRYDLPAAIAAYKAEKDRT